MENPKFEDGSIYQFQRSGRVSSGAKVYLANGCYVCHTQLIRPTYAGTELWRDDWAGEKENEERGDTRRETNLFDFSGEEFAQIGLMRLGPDLSNVGLRIKHYAKKKGISSEEWAYRYLLNPRADIAKSWSKCSVPISLFRSAKNDEKANVFLNQKGERVTPRFQAKVLVDYLLSLKKDNEVPSEMNYKR